MTGTGAPLSILIAEDDPSLAGVLAEYLREKGHQVDVVSDGGEALALLEEKVYSLVITDLVMPKADGLTVLKAARRRDPGTLVMLMTGYASLDSAIGAIREGAYDYLCKPFKLQEIEIAVTNASRLINLHRENEKLLLKLDDLTAKLREMQQLSQFAGDPISESRPRAFYAAGPVPLRYFSPEDQAQQSLSDLERLRDLYKENMLTRDEFQKFKERLLI
jgi:DNA-binding NtrC family response regulator